MQTHIVQCIKIYPLRDIIRSPYLKIRGNSENKASSKAEGGARQGGGGGCKRRGGHPTRGMGMEEREEGGRKSLMCCDALVADLVLPPLIYRDQSLRVILH